MLPLTPLMIGCAIAIAKILADIYVIAIISLISNISYVINSQALITSFMRKRPIYVKDNIFVGAVGIMKMVSGADETPIGMLGNQSLIFPRSYVEGRIHEVIK
ncbi:MAG: hypothetical protein PHI58_05355 [Candidatus Omnitrophica bacterium]|nr:hypothetical protein [Candidatus Omnitrophota bacterium]